MELYMWECYQELEKEESRAKGVRWIEGENIYLSLLGL